MDTKFNQTRIHSSANAQPTAKKRPLFGFIEDLKDELKKVSWTTKDELLLSTKVVVLATFLFGMGIYVFDLVIKGALDLVSLIARFIFG